MGDNPFADRSLAYCLLRIVLGYQYRGTRHQPHHRRTVEICRVAGTPVRVHAASCLVGAFFALSLPWAEALVGLAVLGGVLTRWALVLGILEIAALTFGTTLRQDWESAGLQLSYAVVYALLLAMREYNTYSIDRLLRGRTHP